MAKFFGLIGYSETKQISSGVWEEVITSRQYYGDVIRNTRRWDKGEHYTDDLTINNQISIIADEFAYQNLFAMRCVQWMGALWKITNIDVQRPRLILTIGGLFNEPTTGTPSKT